MQETECNFDELTKRIDLMLRAVSIFVNQGNVY